MTHTQLQKGIHAIREGNMRQARRYLGGYVRAEPNDPSGWWFLAQAVEPVPQKIECLQQVLRLDPTHEEARKLLNTLDRRVAHPTPTDGIQRPILTADEVDDGSLRVPTMQMDDAVPEDDPPPAQDDPTDNRDLYVMAAAVLVSLTAIIGTVVLVVSGTGSMFGFNPPDSTPTPILIVFDPPACTASGDGATVVFINNSPATITLSTAEGELFTLASGAQQQTTVTSEQQIVYRVTTEQAGYAGSSVTLQVPPNNACRIPIR